MIAFRKSFVVITAVAGLIGDRLLKPVFDTEIQDFWKDKVEPYLSTHAFAWAVIAVDWLGPFWSGVGLTLLAMFIVEMILAWHRRNAQDVTTHTPARPRAELIELGRECIAIADETFRTQQQIEDAAPRQVHPPGGYKSNDEWSRAHADFGRELQVYGRRTMMQRDRSHGSDLVDVINRLRQLGLEIPIFADDVPNVTNEMIAVLLPHYLAAYARFVGAMGRMLKRGDLEGAIRASKDYRQTLEGERSARTPHQTPKPNVVTDVHLLRTHDVTSRWYAQFKMALKADELTICLDLQYFGQEGDSDKGEWGGRVRHPIERRASLVFGQTLHIQFVDDAPYTIEPRSPHWRAPLAFEQRGGLTPASNGFVRGSLTFIADGIEQEHRFIVLPRRLDQAMVIIGQESLTGDEFWSDDYKPLLRYLAFGEREVPNRRSK